MPLPGRAPKAVANSGNQVFGTRRILRFATAANPDTLGARIQLGAPSPQTINERFEPWHKLSCRADVRALRTAFQQILGLRSLHCRQRSEKLSFIRTHLYFETMTDVSVCMIPCDLNCLRNQWLQLFWVRRRVDQV